MVSFIVPAHNEQAAIGRTLQAINDSARVLNQPYEIIVVNDASTDATAEIAAQHGAIVVAVNHRKIAATRNSGGRAARGERLFFVDADTTINPRVVATGMRLMDKGAVGGGATVRFEGNLPLYARLLGVVLEFLLVPVGFVGGACMFCTREAFLATGGFDERLFCSEEISFTLALKRQGRFRVMWWRVLTSGRRFHTLSAWQALVFFARLVTSPFKLFTRRTWLEKIWYDSNRANDDKVSDSVMDRGLNLFLLLMTVIILSGPVWNFIPESWMPYPGPLGVTRLAIEIFQCHVGLILWPIGIVLLWNLRRGMNWFEWIKMAAICALCLWQAWDSTRGVIWGWTKFFGWLTRHFMS